MPTINQLSSITTLTSSDQLVVYQTNSGDARKASLGTFLNWFEEAFASPTFATVYAAPTISGFVVTLDQNTQSIWLLLQPALAMAAGTIVIPAPNLCFDGQELLVFSSAEIAALTVNGSGAAVYGAPSYLAANGSFMLRFNALQQSWFCVQPANVAAPTYAETAWTPQLHNVVINGTATVTGRMTSVGRQRTVEVLFEVGVAPGDELKWVYGTCYITPTGPVQVPPPWGAPVTVPAFPLTNSTAMAVFATSVGQVSIAIVEPTGGLDFTLTSGQKLHICATYTV